MGPDLESGCSIGFIPLEETDFLFPNREQIASWLGGGSFSMLGDFVCSELLVPHIQGLVQFSTLVREASFGSEQWSKWEPIYPVMNLKEYLATGRLQMGHLCSLPPRNIKGEA